MIALVKKNLSFAELGKDSIHLVGGFIRDALIYCYNKDRSVLTKKADLDFLVDSEIFSVLKTIRNSKNGQCTIEIDDKSFIISEMNLIDCLSFELIKAQVIVMSGRLVES